MKTALMILVAVALLGSVAGAQSAPPAPQQPPTASPSALLNPDAWYWLR